MRSVRRLPTRTPRPAGTTPAGNEIGDDCAYIYGRTRGPGGGYFNQVINGGKYLTQEEFSNNLFASSGGTAGCLQGE